MEDYDKLRMYIITTTTVILKKYLKKKDKNKDNKKYPLSFLQTYLSSFVLTSYNLSTQQFINFINSAVSGIQTFPNRKLDWLISLLSAPSFAFHGYR